MKAIHTITHDDSSDTASKTSDKIIDKTGNEMRQARTHTWALDTSPKHKSLQNLSIRVNPKVSEEVMHHAGVSQWRLASPFAHVQSHPSVI
jgi:hypothetical protein